MLQYSETGNKNLKITAEDKEEKGNLNEKQF